MRAVAAWSPGTAPYPSQRIYKNKDYVVFSHASHGKASVGCVECHGNVYAMDPLKPTGATTMKACVDCHKSRKASVACNLCHDLGQ